MQLLLSPTSPYARAVRIVMMIKGLDADCSVSWVDTSSDTPELLQANPLSRIPTLILDDGTAITETLLIIQYLERRAPQPSVLPNASALQELSLAGKAIGIMDSALWIMNNRKYFAEQADEKSPLALRRINAIKRTLAYFAEHPPHKVSTNPGMGQILLQVAIEYLEFRLPEFNALEASQLEGWGKSLLTLEPFQLTEFYQPPK